MSGKLLGNLPPERGGQLVASHCLITFRYGSAAIEKLEQLHSTIKEATGNRVAQLLRAIVRD